MRLFDSPDGHELPLDELLGIKPVKSINLDSQNLGPQSASVIAFCIALGVGGSLAQLKVSSHLTPPFPAFRASFGALS